MGKKRFTKCALRDTRAKRRPRNLPDDALEVGDKGHFEGERQTRSSYRDEREFARSPDKGATRRREKQAASPQLSH